MRGLASFAVKPRLPSPPPTAGIGKGKLLPPDQGLPSFPEAKATSRRACLLPQGVNRHDSRCISGHSLVNHRKPPPRPGCLPRAVGEATTPVPFDLIRQKYTGIDGLLLHTGPAVGHEDVCCWVTLIMTRVFPPVALPCPFLTTPLCSQTRRRRLLPLTLQT